MIRVATLVEGYGDLEAIPTLVAKTAAMLDVEACAPHPIRVGEWRKLQRAGELEKSLELTASRGDDIIPIFLDLDDGCAVEERASSLARIEAWKAGRDIRVELVFASKEYGTMFLLEPNCLGEVDGSQMPSNPDEVRGAKECIRRLTGKRYKETQDQLRFTKQMNLSALYRASRVYRKLRRSLTDLIYADLGTLV